MNWRNETLQYRYASFDATTPTMKSTLMSGKNFIIVVFCVNAVCIVGKSPGATTYSNAQHENVVITCERVSAAEYGNLSGFMRYLLPLMREALMRMYKAHNDKSFKLSATLNCESAVAPAAIMEKPPRRC